MSQPIVSVLVTAYNRETFLEASLDSVLAQSFGDFELVIVDDRSSDGTLDVAHEYAKRDRRVRVHLNEVNLGDYGNRNFAATLARAPLIKYHDSDDILYPHCLQVMVPAILAHPTAAFGLSSGSVWPGGPCPMLLTPRMCYQREFLGSGLFNCGPAGAIFRTAWFREIGGFIDYGSPSDYLFWIRVCQTTPVLLLPADLFWYRTHTGQFVHSSVGARKYAEAGRHVWASLFADDCPLTEEEREQARRNVAVKFVKSIWREIRAGRYELARVRWSGGPSVAEWVRYLRFPRRTSQAGTPLDASGDYLTPRWKPETETDVRRAYSR